MQYLNHQFYSLFILVALSFCIFSANGQEKQTITGTVKSKAGVPLSGAGVTLMPGKKSAVTDADGKFQILNVPSGNYKIRVSFIGLAERTENISVPLKTNQALSFSLEEDKNGLSEVTVLGRSAAQETNRQAFNVTAIDAKKLYNTTLDISGALDRVAGIRVRESGGVGSSFNLSLNGFSGNHIKYFIDGIPMDNFGSSFQINNIPINIADRIEVYKGVVPMWLGSDALGGAINIVTGDRYRNYIDASYSYGSFNTHRSVINAAATTKGGLTIQLNAFQNYSDNDYKVKVEAANIYTGAYAPAAKVRRFHDQYHNETLIANVGVVDKSYADKLLFGITLGQNFKEIQTGARMEAVFGARHTRGSLVMPTLKYKKSNLVKGLDVTVNANYNLGYEQNVDTASVRYDWYGTAKRLGTSAEGSGGKTLAKNKDNNGLGTAMLNYKIDEHQSLALSNVFTMFNRKTSDALKPGNEENEKEKKTNKNILGLGYSFDVKEKWSATVFGKYIYQNIINGSSTDQQALEKTGYGGALTYFINRNLQLKTSYELTNRMPEAYEIFGDVENQDSNPNLKPEKSNNLNVGINYNFALNKDNLFSLNANAIYRNATNFIYNKLNQNQGKLVADNRDGVRTWGGDAEIRYSYKNWLSAGATVTYQYLKNLQLIDYKFDGTPSGPSAVYGDQMPNIPYLFGNADVSVSFKDFGKKGSNLNIGYNLLYVHAFWLYWPSQGGRDETTAKKEVPYQFSHDLNFVYSLKNGRYNIGLEARNITNVLLYDNFSLQKPGRSFYLNLRYFFNKNNN